MTRCVLRRWLVLTRAVVRRVRDVGPRGAITPSDRGRRALHRPSIATAPTPARSRSPLRDLGARLRRSTPDAPRHYALILDRGPDALLARVNLIRSARHAIDLQTYIFDEDDAGHLVLDELLAAARRGVRVRMLVDQLSALKQGDHARRAGLAHANFDLRVYNPMFNRSRISYPQYLAASICCWRRSTSACTASCC
jgi:putative cardiolipin synthase